MTAPVDKPAPALMSRFGIIAAALFFAVLVAFTIYLVAIPSPVPLQAH
ncbi:hypothetical protein [Methylobacterium oxalidis]|nr:hypothetical protein [Methylobacterium oxalidis]GJE35413.1 hypothetical protein LDDCCGHA_5631 [Methylobacterium oxalidis]